MSSHRDADALMRAILRNPPDETPRLVFADWLEETGHPSNVAWAHYIRLQAEAARSAEHTLNPLRVNPVTAEVGRSIRAELTVPVRHFLDRPDSLIQLLPPANLRVSILPSLWADGERRIPFAVITVVPESLAREQLFLTLGMVDGVVLGVLPDPANEVALKRILFILDRPVLAVGGSPSELGDAINLHYAPVAVIDDDRQEVYREPIEVDGFDYAEFGNEPDPAGAFAVVEAILALAQQQGADQILFAPGSEEVTVQFLRHGTWETHGPLPAYLWAAIAEDIRFRGQMAGPELWVQYQQTPHGPAIRILLDPLPVP
jgi:uncharacterized protein (TIGR02996 family)